MNVPQVARQGSLETRDPARPPGSETCASPENIGKTVVDAVLIEFNSATPGIAVLPTSPDNLTLKVLAEGRRE